LGWIGHILKRPDRYTAKRAIEWNPQGKCKTSAHLELHKNGRVGEETAHVAGSELCCLTPVDNQCSIRNEEDE